MTIYYTVNTAFIPYLDTFKEELELPSLEANQNWTTQKKILPISLQSTPFDNKLLQAPGTLKGLVQQYKQKGQTLDKSQGKQNYLYVSGNSNHTYYMQTCKTENFINGNCFSASKTSRSSDNQLDKTVLYSTMVCHCSINNDDNTTYYLYLFSQSQVYYI